MSFTYNENLSQNQILLKEKVISEIRRDYSKSISINREISSVPFHTTLDGFVTSVKELIDIDQSNTDQKVILLDNYSETNILQDPYDANKELSGAVIYSLIRRAPGTLAGGNTWFDRSRREVKPRVREIINNDPDNLGQSSIMYSQWFDNEVEFSVCTRTNKRSNELADWFENLMESNRVYFSLKGIGRYLLDQRLGDGFTQIGNEGYHYRPFRYMVRTEKTYTVTEQSINRIIISLTTDNN